MVLKSFSVFMIWKKNSCTMFHQEIVSEQGLSEPCHVRVIASLGEMTYAGAVWRFARKRSPQLAFAQDAKTVVIVLIVISYMFFCIFIWCHHISSYFIHHFNDTTRTEWIQVLLATSQRLRYWWHAFLFAIERVYNCCSDHGWFALVFIISSHLNDNSYGGTHPSCEGWMKQCPISIQWKSWNMLELLGHR